MRASRNRSSHLLRAVSVAVFVLTVLVDGTDRPGLYGLSAGGLVRGQELRLAPRLGPAHRQQEGHRQAGAAAQSRGEGRRVGFQVRQRHVQPVRPGDAQRRDERGRPGRGNPHAAQHPEPGPRRPPRRDGLGAVPARQQPDGRGGHRQRQGDSDLPGDADADPLLRLRRPGPCRGRGVHRGQAGLPHGRATPAQAHHERHLRRLARLPGPARAASAGPSRSARARTIRSTASSSPPTGSRLISPTDSKQSPIQYAFDTLAAVRQGDGDQVEHRLRSQGPGNPLQDRAMHGNPDRPAERPRLQPADAGPHGQHQHAAHGRPEPALHGLRRRSEQLADLLLRAAHAHAQPDPGRAARTSSPATRRPRRSASNPRIRRAAACLGGYGP